MAVGGYDYNFVDTDLPEEFHCLICTSVPRQPHQVTCCGKIYCKQCLDNLKTRNTNFNCPNCHEEIANKYFKDINTQRRIHKLRVYCTNKDSGCTYKVELKDLDSHLTQCLYQLVKCPNQCDVPSVQRQLLQHHLEEGCPNREVSCPHCHITDKHNIVTGSHLETCPDLLIPCPYEECQEYIKRSESAYHRENCIKEIVPCRYANVGCKQRIKREELEDHDEEYVRQHLKMAVDTIKELRLNSNGIFNITMRNFQQYKDSDNSWYCNGFYTSPRGYKISLCIYPNGNGPGKGTHLSCYVCLMSGEYDDILEWPFQGKVTVELLNQLEDRNHKKYVTRFNESTPISSRQRVVRKQYGGGWGYPKFISHTEISLGSSLNRQYLKDDTLYFRVTPTISSTTKLKSTLRELQADVSTLKSRNGIANIKFEKFSQYKNSGDERRSPGFYTSPGGYKMCLCVYPNGYDDGKDTHVSCFLCLMSGEYDDILEWPFQGKVTVELLNQLEDKNHKKSMLMLDESIPLMSSQRVVGKQYGNGLGFSQFIPHSELSLNSSLNRQYLKDDSLYFRVSVTVISKTKPWLVNTILVS